MNMPITSGLTSPKRSVSHQTLENENTSHNPVNCNPVCRKLRKVSHAAVGRGNDTPLHHARGGVP